MAWDIGAFEWVDEAGTDKTASDPVPLAAAEAVEWAAYQNARPDGDVTDGGWLNEVGSNTDLHLSVGEAIPNLATYIRSSASPVNDICTFTLTDIGVPGPGEILIRVIGRWAP